MRDQGYGGSTRDPDEIAIERYRYLLATAPPDQIEQAHAEAFERLTPEQRRGVLEELAREAPREELPRDADDTARLARAATRAEMREPGTLERAFGRNAGWATGPGGPGLGGTFLATIAGVFVGTAIADAMFADHGYPSGDPGHDGGDAGGDGAGGEWGETGSADIDGATADTADLGGFEGDFGGDFGGDVGF